MNNKEYIITYINENKNEMNGKYMLLFIKKIYIYKYNICCFTKKKFNIR